MSSPSPTSDIRSFRSDVQGLSPTSCKISIAERKKAAPAETEAAVVLRVVDLYRRGNLRGLSRRARARIVLGDLDPLLDRLLDAIVDRLVDFRRARGQALLQVLVQTHAERAVR